MQVVLESIDENLARLVPDDKSDEIIISKARLPKTSKVGDVLEMMQNETGGDYVFELLTAETKKRMQNNKNKRERLLKKPPKPFE